MVMASLFVPILEEQLEWSQQILPFNANLIPHVRNSLHVSLWRYDNQSAVVGAAILDSSPS